MHRIATMAEAYDVALAPHCPLGPIALAACMQIATCAPNCKPLYRFLNSINPLSYFTKS